ncbi:MAG: hypothetical protein ACODAJ_05090 [Planctomycetota bacterium]
MKTAPPLTCLLLLAAALAIAGEVTTAPVGLGDDGLGGLELLAVPGVQAEAVLARPEGQPRTLTLTFRKEGQERRLLALAAVRPRQPFSVKALAVTCRLRTEAQVEAHLALAAHETDGGAWFRVSPTPLVAEDFKEARLPLGSLRRAAFARDEDEAIQWGQVAKLWVGLAIDGPAEGTLALRRAVLTNEPYRPTEPLDVTDGGPGQWSVSHDRAATAKITTPPEGPDGKPCMRLDYRFPGGRHMYVVPGVALREIELEGYTALRFACRGRLPEGIDGLLVMLIERDGTQYYAVPAPGVSGDWKTVAVPFERFQRGGWSDDENDRLDLNDVGRVAVGLHGTATETQGKGTLWVAGVQFVP